ncbi:MAG: hypothetical protein Q4F63_07625 [Clostridia bacterium]|nr:hypothetical protein [Clostridia bacterium]
MKTKAFAEHYVRQKTAWAVRIDLGLRRFFVCEGSDVLKSIEIKLTFYKVGEICRCIDEIQRDKN